MATYDINQQWTLLERAKRSADGKKILPVLEVMNQLGVPDMLNDVPYIEANRGMQHRLVRTASHPSSTRRTFYQGVARTATTTQVVNEEVCLFEQRSEIDEAHLDTLVNPKEARRQEDRGHVAGMMEDLAYSIFNDARTSGSEYFDGLAPRMSALTYPGHTTTAIPYVWDNGGAAVTGYLSSVYIIEWGPQACFCIYPSGSVKTGQYGIDIRNKGKEKVPQSDDVTKSYYAYVTQFVMWTGFGCADDRKVARIANITHSSNSTTAPFDEDILIKLLNHGRFDTSRTRIYMNAYIKSDMDIRAKDKANVNWTVENVFGKPTRAFLGIPVRVLDEVILPATESAIA